MKHETVMTVHATSQVYKEYLASGLWIEVDSPKYHKIGQNKAVVNAAMKSRRGQGEVRKLVEIIIALPFKK